jgi:hypothetical protein
MRADLTEAACRADHVMPSEFGTRQQPWFCLRPAYWRKAVQGRRLIEEPSEVELSALEDMGDSALDVRRDDDVEAVDSAREAVSVQGVSKVPRAALRRCTPGPMMRCAARFMQATPASAWTARTPAAYTR